MGRASSNKKVSRVARTGGGRAVGRSQRPLGWYTALAAVVLLGTLTLVFSRAERREEVAAGQTSVPPFEQGSPRKPGGDHWHAALGVYACGDWLPPLEDNGRDPEGIHTHGDGVIHIHPFTRRAAGKNATLGVYERAMGIEFSEREIKYAGKTFTEGDDECDGKPAKVKLFVDGEEVEGDPSDHRFATDRQMIVVAFVPEGVDVPEKPPSASQLDNLSDVPGGGPVDGPAESPTPGDDSPAETTPGDDSPAETTPGDDSPAETTPSSTSTTSG